MDRPHPVFLNATRLSPLCCLITENPFHRVAAPLFINSKAIANDHIMENRLVEPGFSLFVQKKPIPDTYQDILLSWLVYILCIFHPAFSKKNPY